MLTLNSAHEGQDSQRVFSTVSSDEGRTWTPLVDVEPHVAAGGRTPRSTGWINNLLLPASGDQLGFYTFNCDNVTTRPTTGSHLANANLLGCWVFRRSVDTANMGQSGHWFVGQFWQRIAWFVEMSSSAPPAPCVDVRPSLPPSRPLKL